MIPIPIYLDVPMVEHHVIRCPIGLVELWDYFAQNPSIASKVETLEIQRQKSGFNFDSLAPVVVPDSFIRTAQEFIGDGRPYHSFLNEYWPGARMAEKSLIRAIKKMSGLRSFKWCREPPLLDSQLDAGIEDDLWTVLRSCETLRDLDVVDAGDIEIEVIGEIPSTSFRPIQLSQMVTLSNLTTFRYNNYAYNGRMKCVPMQALNEMLQKRCPLLENLALRFSLYHNGNRHGNTDLTTVDLSPLFSDARWLHLAAVELYGAHLTPSAAIKFLSCHPSITIFRVIEATHSSRFIKPPSFDVRNPGPPEILVLSANILPHLKTLLAPPYFTHSILHSVTTQPRPLAEIRISSENMTPFVLDVLSTLPIKKVYVGHCEPRELQTLAKAIPDLPELGAYTSDRKDENTEWLDALAHFTKLEVLHHSRLIGQFNTPMAIERVLRSLVVRLPILRKITMYGSSQDAACDVTREGDRIHWKIVALQKEGIFDI